MPGCRAPHFWLPDGRSLYDAMGDGYCLIRFVPDISVSGLVEAAAWRRMPLSVLDVDDVQAAKLYARSLVLVRPDRHVAWRDNEEPVAPMDLIDRVCGAHLSPVSKVA